MGKTDYQARGVLYLPEASRFSKLLNLPEGADIGKAINEAMRAIEVENEELKDILPKTYNHLDNSTLVELLKTFNSMPMDIEGDARGSEQDIRKSLIENSAVDVMVAVGSNFFYTVTLPCTLWFLDRGKTKSPRKDKVFRLQSWR